MKTLEKDRSRRYETASAFAADVQRYLNDEAVQACPPSALYRFRKFARRNKAGVLTAASVALGLLLAIGGLLSAVLIQTASSAKVSVEITKACRLVRRMGKPMTSASAALSSAAQTRPIQKLPPKVTTVSAVA